MEQPVEKEYYTFADCLTWPESDRIEIIDGEAYMMSPPMRLHQKILIELAGQIRDFLKDKPCEVYPAPFGVRLFEQEGDTPDDVDTLVEPDISVVCDKSKLDDYGCKGAPDLIIEILSPSNKRHDRIVKHDLYQRAKVREYWIVDPQDQTVEVYLLNENGFLKPSEMYSAADTAKITVLKDCTIDLIAKDKESGKILAGKCKWGSRKFAEEDLEELIFSLDAAGVEADCYYLFSKSGFSGEISEREHKTDKLKLTALEEM